MNAASHLACTKYVCGSTCSIPVFGRMHCCIVAMLRIDLGLDPSGRDPSTLLRSRSVTMHLMIQSTLIHAPSLGASPPVQRKLDCAMAISISTLDGFEVSTMIIAHLEQSFVL
ncbi:uncharacterized protein BDW70DRAFT_101995 [Aspergillus foveolatus]|uniref:uncharacterized protein n=1 Tax=Aspergillus foveolatus TaxID=210207 RepID=UPI003CCD148E